MSFLLRPLPRKVSPLAGSRLFTTSPYVRKTASETAKETVENVNKTVGDAAVKGIEKGQQATATLKSSVGVKAKEASGSAQEMTGEAKGKASEMAGEAKGKASEVSGEAKGKAEEIKGKM
ncbi:hypothetical protein ACLMJK_000069 [Lecanora helva]